MGLFGLGLIGGAAQGFSEFKTRQREDENLRKQQEREDQLRKEERAWQLMQYDFQTLSQQQQALFAAGLKQEETDEAREFQKNQLKTMQDANPDYLIFPQQFAAMQRKKTASSLYVPPFPSSDPTKPSFVYTNKRGEPVGFPGFDKDAVKDNSERANFFRQALSVMSPDEIAYHLDRYERRNNPEFTGQDFISQYMNALGTYRQPLTDALTYKEGDNIFIRAPNYDFGLDRLPPEVAQRFATTVFPSLFGIGVEEIRKTFEIPKHVPITYDQYSNTFQINEKVVNDSRWAIEKDPNGDWVYNPQIFAQAREIAGHSGTKVIDVMTFAGTSSTPQKRLNNILNAKAVFGNTLVKDNSGLYRTTPAFENAIIPLISNLTEKDALQFLRLIVPAEDGAPVRSFQMVAGSAKPILLQTYE
jgi:predicted regulator of amino acid metabolism with ACT domain